MSKAVRHQLDRADPGIQRPLTITVAISAPFWCAFVAFSTQLHGHLQLHQLLSQHAHTFAKENRPAPRRPCAARLRVPFSVPRPSVWLPLITDLDNRHENHLMTVRVNGLPIYTRPGTLPVRSCYGTQVSQQPNLALPFCHALVVDVLFT